MIFNSIRFDFRYSQSTQSVNELLCWRFQLKQRNFGMVGECKFKCSVSRIKGEEMENVLKIFAD